MYNVVCMKWGEQYNANDVNILNAMVKRNTKLPIRFICYTDNKQDINKEVECYDLPEIYVPKHKDVSPWRKLGIFSKKLPGKLTGKVLFLDLDIVVTGNIDGFFTYSDKFAIIENWTQLGEGIGNSSVFCFTPQNCYDIYEYYKNNTEEVLNSHSNEQIFVSHMMKNKVYWPDQWVRSFKRHCLPHGIMRWFKTPILPKGARIIAFHGRPKPIDALLGKWPGKSWYKYVKPTPWIGEYWVR